MVSNYILIIFFVIGKFGYSQTEGKSEGVIRSLTFDKSALDTTQTVPSDTINYKGNVFHIVLPAKYNYKLVPKILRDKIVLVDTAENKVECLISNYTFGAVRNQRYIEHIIGQADLTSVFNAFIDKETSTFWVSKINCSTDFSGRCKPIIGSFKMERIK